MSFLTVITRSSSSSSIPTASRTATTRGPSFLAAYYYHTSPRLRTPETSKRPAGEQSQQKLREKMNTGQQWSEESASWSESMVKADRGEVEGSAEVDMEATMRKWKKNRPERTGTGTESGEKKPQANMG